MRAYKILKIILQFIALLPFPALYTLSDFLYVFIYYLFRYRRKIVEENIAYAFPEKSASERNKIARQFYRNLADMIFETVKMLRLPDWQLQKRFTMVNSQLLEKHMQGPGIVLLLGHQFNWEWGYWVLNQKLENKVIAVYTPIKNPIFEKLIKELRGAKGGKLAKSVDKRLLQIAQPTLTALIADQSPSNLAQAYWRPFMNRTVPYHAGFEKLIYKTGQIPILATVQKIKRGYYQAIFEAPFAQLPPYHKGVLIEPYADFLEKNLKQDPANYLWSHRRWKHAPKTYV